MIDFDLLALLKTLKNLKSQPLFKTHRELCLNILREISLQKIYGADEFLTRLQQEGPELYHSLQKAHEEFKKNFHELLELKSRGVGFTSYGDAIYPRRLYWMAEPPLILYFKGSLESLNSPCMSVVGSRDVSFESLQWMEQEFFKFCKLQSPCVVSGGARGVDQKSHALALRANLPTVVVLPSGLGALYPESLGDWVEPVMANNGAFVSEYDYGQRMHKHLFHHRNRLIAALGVGSFLIEARRRSGTLITAQQTLQLGRPLWVLPGHPLDPHFGGSLDLISEGASIVRDAEDLSMLFNSEVSYGMGSLVLKPESDHYQ